MGKYYPAYHCSKQGHYYRVPKAAFEQAIEDVVKRLQINPEQLDTIEAKWNEKQAQIVANDKRLEERRQELETQISAVIDRMKMVSSETVIKRMEGEILDIEKQIVELGNSNEQPENTVDIKVILQYARFLVEHLAGILLHLRNPLRKAAFFGAIFNKVPTYEDLVGGTQKTAQLPGVNELFRISEIENPFMVISPGIEPGLQG